MIKRFKNYIHNADEFEENLKKDIIESIVDKKLEKEDKIKNDNFIQIKKKNNENQQEQQKSIEFKFCDICKQKLYSNQDFKLHIISKKHEKNIRKITLNEIRNCGSIKKYLIMKKLITPLKKSNLNKARYMLYSFALNKMIKKIPFKNK